MRHLAAAQGSQYGVEQTRTALLEKGFQASMSRAGTPTDNGYAERFVGIFKLAVAERRPYHTLGEFLQAAENWINFYISQRPHEALIEKRGSGQKENDIGSVKVLFVGETVLSTNDNASL
jgi:transposase InsO family protein